MQNDEYLIVIGGEGFVGSSLISYLHSNTDYKLISFDCNLTGVTRKRIISDRVEYVSTDLYGENSTINLLTKCLANLDNIKAIFHFGEYSRVVPSLNNIETVLQSNVHLTTEIINLCRITKTELIYSASSTRFNHNGEVDQLSCNKLPYPYFKSMMVDTIKRFGEWYPADFKYKIVYFYNVYGDGQVEDGEYATVIGIWNKAYREGRPIPVIGDGSQTRDFTHITDIVNGIYLAFKNGINTHEYHLGTGTDQKIIDLAKLYNTDIEYLPKINQERMSGRAPANNLSKTELGWSPNHNIIDYIKNTVK